MCHLLLRDTRLYEHLLRIDRDLAETERARGCPRCGGRLDVSDYPRKPRGAPATLPEGYERRFSFCCDGCRKRVTPPSVRFLGRRVYLGPVFLIVSAMQGALTPRRLRRILGLFGADRRTVMRWRAWWHEQLATTVFGRALAERCAPPPVTTPLAVTLLARSSGGARDRVIAVLQLLSPLSTL